MRESALAHKPGGLAGIGCFGTYTEDENGQLSGDRVEGSTFSNWAGDVRTRQRVH
jgi:hypothetical protein